MASINPLSPPAPQSHDNQLTWDNLTGSAKTLAISRLAQTQQKPLLLVTPDVQTAEKCLNELQFFAKDSLLPIHYFPDPETLPYDHFSPHEDLTSRHLLM